jgi:hypothetical protein
MLSGPSGSLSSSSGVYAKRSFSVTVLVSGSKNHTCPSCDSALLSFTPTSSRANEDTKYAPPSPHHAPSSLRLRVMSPPAPVRTAEFQKPLN